MWKTETVQYANIHTAALRSRVKAIHDDRSRYVCFFYLGIENVNFKNCTVDGMMFSVGQVHRGFSHGCCLTCSELNVCICDTISAHVCSIARRAGRITINYKPTESSLIALIEIIFHFSLCFSLSLSLFFS